MHKINRRNFIKTGITGLAGLPFIKAFSTPFLRSTDSPLIDYVDLGKTGLTISRIGLGTGTVGYNNASNQTRLGMDQFVQLARHCYDQGIRYFDMADGYGSHEYVGNAIKGLPRETITLCTKVWTHPEGSDKIESVEKTLDRYRKEIDTDYIDILLMHCLMEGGWTTSRKYYMDALSEAKQRGIVKTVGVSCHNWDALKEASESPWVDVILARINPFETHMDGSTEEVNKLLKTATDNGKGVIGMKIFGEGKNISDAEREESLRFAIQKAHMHCMTIGLESLEQVDDLVKRTVHIMRS